MTVRPIHPRPLAIPGQPVHRLLHGVLRVAADTRFIARLVLIDDSLRCVAFTDSGNGTPGASAERDLALHVLWARDETHAAIDVAGHGALSVAPGDTVTLAAGTRWTYGPGLLTCEIGGPAGADATRGRIAGPTHGIERFHGHNRQTLCAVTPEFSLERWKITQPLTLPGDAAIVNLVEPMALVWPGGSDLIGRGELRIVPPRIDKITLLPDGLGYAVVIRPHPDITSLTATLSPEEIADVML